MRYEVRTFIKQVQVDLLALSDADLCQTIGQWGPGQVAPGVSLDALEARCSALGYTPIRAAAHSLAHAAGTVAGVEPEARVQWQAPSPDHLRRLLTEMDLKQFAEHVIALAFQALHAAHPEWGEASTFNAHLANHLRWLRMNGLKHDQGTRRPSL